jgi:hypothetical protein
MSFEGSITRELSLDRINGALGVLPATGLAGLCRRLAAIDQVRQQH